MTRIAQLLDEKLQALDPERARNLEALVTQAINQVERETLNEPNTGWPEAYFERTAGALAGEDFERPPQGAVTPRNEW